MSVESAPAKPQPAQKDPGALLADNASLMVQLAGDNFEMSALQMAAVIRIAAATCDEIHAINEKAEVAARVRGMFRPPGGMRG
jgi:hypothetical protein